MRSKPEVFRTVSKKKKNATTKKEYTKKYERESLTSRHKIARGRLIGGLVKFYGISTLGYFIPNPVFTCICEIYMICERIAFT